MAKIEAIPGYIIHEIWQYDAEEGRIYMKDRPRSHFLSDHAYLTSKKKIFNNRIRT
jgi:hypothetical protein